LFEIIELEKGKRNTKQVEKCGCVHGTLLCLILAPFRKLFSERAVVYLGQQDPNF